MASGFAIVKPFSIQFGRTSASLAPAVNADHAALEVFDGEVLGLIVNVDAALPLHNADNARGASERRYAHVLEIHGRAGRPLLNFAASDIDARFSHELFVPVGNHPERIDRLTTCQRVGPKPNGRTAAPLITDGQRQAVRGDLPVLD